MRERERERERERGRERERDVRCSNQTQTQNTQMQNIFTVHVLEGVLHPGLEVRGAVNGEVPDQNPPPEVIVLFAPPPELCERKCSLRFQCVCGAKRTKTPCLSFPKPCRRCMRVRGKRVCGVKIRIGFSSPELCRRCMSGAGAHKNRKGAECTLRCPTMTTM